MAHTAARVDMVISNNATWEDAFEFGTIGDTSWSFTAKSFFADIKGTRDDPNALLSLSSADSTIVVDDAAQRILHFEVDEDTITANLPITEDCDPYIYDLVMVDNVTSVRTVLMWGYVTVEQGITL